MDPNEATARQIATATIEATIIRRDGTREDLGVIASTEDGSITTTPPEPKD